jgi:thiol-disulfide isomerase/thioredoxin
MIETPTPKDRRRRLLPWAVGLAVVVLGVTVMLAFTGDDDATSEDATAPAAGATADTPANARLPISAGLATDEPAPDFDADVFDGSPFRLSDHQAADGRPVLLNLWASWCFPCREEMPAIDAVAARHPEVMFIGVAVEDDPVEAERFADEIGVSYLLAIDETGAVSQKYPALGLPATFLISEDGRVIAKLFGGASEETFDQFLRHLDS